MALLIPTLLPPLRTDAGRFRELEVLERLRDYLPAGFDVFHNIALHTLRDGRDVYGEIDVAVLGPGGALLLMEVKAGQVLLREGSLFKLYTDRECDIARQSRLQRAAIQQRLREAGLDTALLSCLVLPDFMLGESEVLSVPRERIIDASNYDKLVSLVRGWLAGVDSGVDRSALQRLLCNAFEVIPDAGVMRDQLRATVRRLADGLATWVPRIGSPSGIFRIQATAGSGKTQLALQLLDDAIASARPALYVCYNRSLADHVRVLASPRAQVINYHELCVDHWRATHGTAEFSPQGFQRMTEAYHAASASFAADLALLIIDEAQDFDASWVECLCQRLQPGARLYLLEDESQRLYQHDSFALDDAVTIDCSDNFRSPRLICDFINALGLVRPPIRSLNPYRGALPAIHTYQDEAQLRAASSAAVSALLARGFALADIVVLSGRGRERSALLGRATLGPWLTRRFTGEYDARGEPRWSTGQLLIESVYRYKGQSAPAVVITEFDFDELDAATRKRLFVALTRAQMAVELVLSQAAEACLAQIIEGVPG